MVGLERGSYLFYGNLFWNNSWFILGVCFQMIFIKKVSRATGGDKRFLYGVLTVPKEYIGKPLFVKVASKEECEKYGVVEIGKGKWDSKTQKRWDARKKRLKKHLDKLKEVRNSSKT